MVQEEKSSLFRGINDEDGGEGRSGVFTGRRKHHERKIKRQEKGNKALSVSFTASCHVFIAEEEEEEEESSVNRSKPARFSVTKTLKRQILE